VSTADEKRERAVAIIRLCTEVRPDMLAADAMRLIESNLTIDDVRAELGLPRQNGHDAGAAETR
jgi:hypothetical protein